MSGATPVIPPAGYEFSDGPRKRYVEQYASSLVLNNYLKVGSHQRVRGGREPRVSERSHKPGAASFKPMVIRVDEVGRASAVNYAASTYQPQAPELKYFLIEFVTDHYSRMRATVRENYARSLYFMDAPTRGRDHRIEQEDKDDRAVL